MLNVLGIGDRLLSPMHLDRSLMPSRWEIGCKSRRQGFKLGK